MEYRNHRNRKGQTGLPYNVPNKSTKASPVTNKAEPVIVNGFARYTLIQTIAVAVILAVFTAIRLISGNLYQDVQVGMNGQGLAGANISDAAQQVMSYMRESETFSQLFPADDVKSDQGEAAVWTTTVLSEEKTSRWMKKEELICPIRYTEITSEYGYRTDPFSGQRTFHTGIDMAAPEGNHVFSVHDGLVLLSEYDEVGGWYIVIEHAGQLQTYYGHLSKILVEKGNRVQAGQVIGLSGNSGKTTGPHLHFEVVDHGETVDPTAYIYV